MTRAILFFALLGGTLGVMLDAWHVASDTTRYAEPWMFGIATWTIPLFASAGVLVGVVPVAVERAMHFDVPRTTMPRCLAGIALFVLAYFLTGLLRGATCAIVLAILAIAIWMTTERPPARIVLVHAALAGLGGALVEMTLVHFGAFFHDDARLFGVAPWLPLLYVCASLALTPLARNMINPSAASAR